MHACMHVCVIQGAAALVVHLVNSGWFDVVLGRSVQYGHSFQQLVLAYVILLMWAVLQLVTITDLEG